MKNSWLVTAFLKEILLAALVIVGMVGTAVAATVSGTITNNTSKSGWVFIAVQWQGGGDTNLGVSIDPAVTTNYAIRGVQQGGMYRVKAFMDTQNTGIQHANDPVGYSSSFTVTGTSYSGANITLNNPTPVALQAPTSASVILGDKAAMVFWRQATDTFGNEIATSYKVYWSVTPNPGPSNMSGGGSSPPIKIYENGYYVAVFPSNGGQYYFSVTAFLNSVESTPTNVNGGALITIGTPIGGVTVSGTVNIQGISLTPAKPLGIFLNTYGGPRYIAVISASTNNQAYTISGVQPGVYIAGAALTMNNSGLQDEGVVNTFGGQGGVPITVEGSPLSNVDMTLNAGNASPKVMTDHSVEGYGLNFDIRSQLMRPVNVAISGPQLVEIFDLAPSNKGRFQSHAGVPARPTLLPSPDSYTFAITYSDGSNTGASPFAVPITGVVDSFATLSTPIGTVPYPFTPASFTWIAPSNPPTPSYYSYGVSVANSQDITEGFLPLNTASVTVPYTFSEGITYNWGVGVYDRNGNRATSSTSFTPSSNPAITSFTPTSGVPGTWVTISGANFDGTTPANNHVVFPGTGVYAPVVSATTTQLVVTVPSGAAPGSGPINLYIGAKSTASSSYFTILATISASGTIRNSAGVVSGAVISLPGNTLVTTTSAGNGTYTLAGLPSGQPFSFKISKSPYPDVYSKNYTSTSDLTGADFRLFTADVVAGWGVATGKGVIRGRVKNKEDDTYISGAIVTINAPNPAGYTIVYANTDFEPTPSLTSTSVNGTFYILNITPGDSITTSATATGFSNASAKFTAHADAVTQGGINMTDIMRPTIDTFTIPATYNSLTVPITSLSASDNAAVTGYKLTESASAPLPDAAGWSLPAPASFIFSATGAHTVYAWAKDATGNVSFGSNQNVFVAYRLTVNMTGWGTVTETSAFPTLSCINPPNSSCYQLYAPVAPLRLAATPYSGYEFQSWTTCTPTIANPLLCDLNLTGDTSVSATFLLTSKVRIGVSYYPSINAAVAVAADRDIIQLRDLDLQENVSVNRSGITITIRGGYDADFNPTSGFSALNKLTIRGGKIIVSKIKIQ